MKRILSYQPETIIEIESLAKGWDFYLKIKDVLCNSHGNHKGNSHRIYTTGNEKGIKIFHYKNGIKIFNKK